MGIGSFVSRVWRVFPRWMPPGLRLFAILAPIVAAFMLLGVFVFEPLVGRLTYAFGREHLFLLNASDSAAVVEIAGERLTIAAHGDAGIQLRTGRTYAARVRFDDGVSDAWSLEVPPSKEAHTHAATVRPGTCIALVDVSRVYGLPVPLAVLAVTRDRMVSTVDYDHVASGALPASIDRSRNSGEMNAYWLTPVPCDVGPGAAGIPWLRETFGDIVDAR